MASGNHHETASPSEKGALLATPETAATIAAAGPLAVLVGSYDGSGNFGDIAQLDAALGLLDGIDSELLVLPVVERQFAATHESMAQELLNRPRHVLYFDQGGDPGGEGLVAVEPPHGAPLAISYLYGGGFLNPSWGARKLAMLGAVEDLLAAVGRVVRIASGQQVDRGWIERLGPADVELLRRFELWGGRDGASAQTLGKLGAAFNGGDDAVGILAATGGRPAPEHQGPLEVNVHFAEHEWVTDRPDAAREFDVQLLAELSRLAGRPLRVRPLLAYLDSRIDERPGLERFAAACAESQIELIEPRVLRPNGIGDQLAALGGAAFTVSSSYHAALTSLLLATPTAILRDNDYYAQKARGLLNDFGLPAQFSPRSSDDPKAAASAIAPHLLDPEVRGRTRRQLEAAAGRVRRRRVETEAKLTTAIAQGALAVAQDAPARPSRSRRITAPLRRLAAASSRDR